MTDAQEEIKATLTVVTPESQSRKRDEEKDTTTKNVFIKKEPVTVIQNDDRDTAPLLGRYCLSNSLEACSRQKK